MYICILLCILSILGRRIFLGIKNFSSHLVVIVLTENDAKSSQICQLVIVLGQIHLQGVSARMMKWDQSCLPVQESCEF